MYRLCFFAHLKELKISKCYERANYKVKALLQMLKKSITSVTDVILVRFREIKEVWLFETKMSKLSVLIYGIKYNKSIS